VPNTKIARRKAAMTASEKALLDVVRIVGNQRDLLQRWLRRRDSQRNRQSPAGIGYPTLIRH
jgi:hypothetical protein